MRAVVAALLLAPALLIIAAGFAAPLIRLAILSVSATAGPLAAYRELVTVDVYRIILRNTVVLALVV
jgi:ABC-type sugar transport system permease subunit